MWNANALFAGVPPENLMSPSNFIPSRRESAPADDTDQDIEHMMDAGAASGGLRL